jgi:hypothetical protein
MEINCVSIIKETHIMKKPFVSCFADIGTTREQSPEMKAAKAHYAKMVNDLRIKNEKKDLKPLGEETKKE